MGTRPSEFEVRRAEAQELAWNVVRVLRLEQADGHGTLGEFSLARMAEQSATMMWVLPGEEENVKYFFSPETGNKMPMFINLKGAVLAYLPIGFAAGGDSVGVSTYLNLFEHVSTLEDVTKLHEMLQDVYRIINERRPAVRSQANN